MEEGNLVLSGAQPSPRRPRWSATLEYDLDSHDRISRLPDDILVLILNKLPMSGARTTSLLAKRWKDLWKYKTDIVIDNCFPKRAQDITFSTCWYLATAHQGQKIERLCLSSRCNIHEIHTVERCISEAVKKNVEEIDINLFGSKSQTQRVRLCFNLLSHDCGSSVYTSVIKLTLNFMRLQRLPTFFTNLRELHLGQVEFVSPDAVEMITTHCSLLRLLSLSNCSIASGLRIIISPTCHLHKLIIKEDLSQVSKRTGLYLSAPSVTFVEFVSGLPRREYQVGPLPMAKEVKFNLDQMFHDRRTLKVCKNGLIGKQFRLSFLGLLSGLKNANVLSLSSWCIQIIGAEVIFRRELCTLEATHVFMDTCLSVLELIGTVGLLRACQGIKMLSISIIPESEPPVLFHRSLFRGYSSGLMPAKLDFDGSDCYDALEGLPELEVVEFKNFLGNYEIPDDGTFDEGSFFKGTESGPMTVSTLKEKAKNLRKIIFASRKRVFEVNLRDGN